MVIKTKAIVLSAIKYQEKALIVKCFTFSDGVKSYFVRNAFTASKTGQKRAYFQALSLLEIEATHKNNNSLHYFKEIKTLHPFHSIYTNISKSTIALFVSEMLCNAIKEEEKNEALFHFLETALLWLDAHDEIANFHLILLLEMTKFLGFYPEDAALVFSFFDLKEGVFTNLQSGTAITESETILFKKLLPLKLGDTSKTFSANDRQILLKTLVDYYAVHLDNFRKPKSIDVLRDVFS
jgi:DNA repair protein RecO (recombination protein O)